MRKKEREITNFKEIEEIIEKSDVCHIALSSDNIPYIVTMNFGYKKSDNPALFFHCAGEGKKIDIIKRNNTVCFQMDIDHELVKADMGCQCSMQYRSVVGMGKISFITKKEDKIEALNILMNHYTGEEQHPFEEEMINRTYILRLDIDEISGKKCKD